MQHEEHHLTPRIPTVHPPMGINSLRSLITSAPLRWLNNN